jgi:hypothetical protein
VTSSSQASARERFLEEAPRRAGDILLGQDLRETNTSPF